MSDQWGAPCTSEHRFDWWISDEGKALPKCVRCGARPTFRAQGCSAIGQKHKFLEPRFVGRNQWTTVCIDCDSWAVWDDGTPMPSVVVEGTNLLVKCGRGKHDFGKPKLSDQIHGGKVTAQLGVTCHRCHKYVSWDVDQQPPDELQESRAYQDSRKDPKVDKKHSLRVVNKSLSQTHVTLDGVELEHVMAVRFEHKRQEYPVIEVECATLINDGEAGTVIFDGEVRGYREPEQVVDYIATRHGLVSVEDPQCQCGEQDEEELYEEHIARATIERLLKVTSDAQDAFAIGA